MAMVQAKGFASIDVAMITIVTNETTPRELSLRTATKIDVEVQIETQAAVKLVIKGQLKAQKKPVNTVTGTKLKLKDNIFTPELAQIVQGGTVTTDVGGAITGYEPPAIDDTAVLPTFTTNVYSAIYDESGTVIKYEKVAYPNCSGNPIAFSSEDGVFRAPEYTIDSAPSTGDAPYVITYIAALPTV